MTTMTLRLLLSLSLLPPLIAESSMSNCLGTRRRPNIASSSSSIAFAGGFGAKSTSTRSKKKRNKKKQFLSELPRTQDQKQPTESQNDAQKLDKWGLPIPTTDDLFPRMPPETELISATKDDYTLEEIQHALSDHMTVKMDHFHEDSPLKIRLLHQSPPVLAIENFMTPQECQDVKNVVLDPATTAVQVNSATFSPLAQSKRTSTSWFCHYQQLSTFLAKAHHVLGIPLEQMEEPQIVRYKEGQEFSWHYDEVPPTQLDNGGQRIATLLVYLNDMDSGGGTVFRDLTTCNQEELMVLPKLGSALLFFPAYADGRPDDRTLHKGDVIREGEKWIVQMWIHQRAYNPVLPRGNSQEAAKADMERASRDLGFV